MKEKGEVSLIISKNHLLLQYSNIPFTQAQHSVLIEVSILVTNTILAFNQSLHE